jgi:hypothetical protein
MQPELRSRKNDLANAKRQERTPKRSARSSAHGTWCPRAATHKAGCLRGLAMFISFRLPWLLLLANRAVRVSAAMVGCLAITVRVGSNFVSDTY